MTDLFSHAGIVFMRVLAHLPLSWLRALGWGLGHLLYLLVRSRRHVVQVNLRLCFAQLDDAARCRMARDIFIRFAQAWVDRSWLWHGSPEVTRRRLKLTGEVHALEGTERAVIFAPHFMGMDAGWTALTQQVARNFTTIYTNQSNQVVDAWVLAGRRRYGRGRLFGRIDGVKSIVAALRSGEPLYLLPDMSFGVEDSVFVPFFGVPTATVPSLSRFARLARAKVVPVLSRMSASGYAIEVYPAWENFPTDDPVADTARMNRQLQDYIATMPEQYYWVHKRFKDRPPGEQSVY